MPSSRSQALAATLRAQPIGGWRVLEGIDHGKSAVVLRAERDGQMAALKVYNRDLVEEQGLTVQLARLERELELRSHGIPHLINIIDGGVCTTTGHVYLAMELIEHRDTVARSLSTLPRSTIPTILDHIASAAHELELRQYVHRDIKPSNILITPAGTDAVLLDLGIIKPADGSTITDDADFIGTRQYASPEFLFGEDEDTVEGGRALTFYQLGALLHDLIMQRPIFDGVRPYAKMVEAVRSTTPLIVALQAFVWVRPEIAGSSSGRA